MLRVYTDENCTNEITDIDAEVNKMPVEVGEDWVHEREIFIKSDDPLLNYENVLIKGFMDIDGTNQQGEIDVLYALDDQGSPGVYKQTLNLPPDNYESPYKIWRKIYSPNVTTAFKEENIKHELYSEEYMR